MLGWVRLARVRQWGPLFFRALPLTQSQVHNLSVQLCGHLCDKLCNRQPSEMGLGTWK